MFQVQWAPTAAAKSYATRDVIVEGAEPGDAVSVGLGALGDAAALLSANVAAAGRVRVLLHNIGAAVNTTVYKRLCSLDSVSHTDGAVFQDLKLPESTLRVVVQQYIV